MEGIPHPPKPPEPQADTELCGPGRNPCAQKGATTANQPGEPGGFSPPGNSPLRTLGESWRLSSKRIGLEKQDPFKTESRDGFRAVASNLNKWINQDERAITQ